MSIEQGSDQRQEIWVVDLAQRRLERRNSQNIIFAEFPIGAPPFKDKRRRIYYSLGTTQFTAEIIKTGVDVKVEAGFDRIGRKSANAGKNRKAIGGQSTFFENQSDPVPDAMEARLKGFHRKVRRLFLDVHKYYPTSVITVDGQGERQDVHDRVLESLSRVFD